MAQPLDILILRDPREAWPKCSLAPLRGSPGVTFLAWRPERVVDVGQRLWLDPEGDELSAADAGLPLFAVDCAWKWLPKLRRSVRGELVRRRLPPLATAYPRRSKVFVDPAAGLATIEALYAGLALAGEPRPELLAHYRWREAFLVANPILPRG